MRKKEEREIMRFISFFSSSCVCDWMWRILLVIISILGNYSTLRFPALIFFFFRHTSEIKSIKVKSYQGILVYSNKECCLILLIWFQEIVFKFFFFFCWLKSIEINARERRKASLNDLQVYISVTWFVFFITKLPWLLYAAWKGNDSSITLIFSFFPKPFQDMKHRLHFTLFFFFFLLKHVYVIHLFLSLQTFSFFLFYLFFAYCFHTQTFTVTRWQLNQKNTFEHCLALAYRKKKPLFLFIFRLFMV